MGCYCGANGAGGADGAADACYYLVRKINMQCKIRQSTSSLISSLWVSAQESVTGRTSLSHILKLTTHLTFNISRPST